MAIRIEHGGAGTSAAAGQLLAVTGQQELSRQQQQRQFDVGTIEGAVTREQQESQFERGLSQQRGLQANQAANQAAGLTQQLDQQRTMQMQQIDAQASRQREAADDATARIAMQFGLEGQIREQEFNRAIKQKQESARLQADEWEFRYTTQQRQEIAKFNQARQAIKSSEGISPEEKQAMLLKLDMQQAGMEPSMIPAAADRPKFEEGKPANSTYFTDGGAEMQVMLDGSVKMITRSDQNVKYLQAKQKAESQAKIQAAEIVQQQTIAAAELKAKQARDSDIAKVRMELLQSEVPTGAIDASGFRVEGEPGKPEMRFRSLDEVNALINQAYGGGRQQETQNWWERDTSQGLDIDPDDEQLPPNVGYAKAYLRTLLGQYGNRDSVPERYKEAMNEAGRIFAEHQSGAGF